MLKKTLITVACAVFFSAIAGIVLFINPPIQKLLWTIVAIYLAVITLAAYNWVRDFKKATRSDSDEM